MKSKVYCVTLVIFAVIQGVVPECSQTSPCTPLRGGALFRKPSEEKSRNGSMHSSLTVQMSDFTLDWLTVNRRLYNGEYPGTTFYWKPGDTIFLTLINLLDQPDYSGEPHALRFPNSTNVHTHGLHISSKEPQDNVLIQVGPRNEYQYMYHIHPKQAAGTYFYHPHKHGSAYFQNLGGMSGMIIIEDDPKTMSPELDAASCPNNCDNDIPMVFQLFQYRSDEDGSFSVAQKDIHDDDMFRLNSFFVKNTSQNLEDWLENSENDILYMLVNGQLQPVLEMRPGEIKRFRMVNAAGLSAIALSIDDDGSSSCSVMKIATDGHYLDSPRNMENQRSLLIAAGRVDWLVICNSPGEFVLRSAFSHDDEMSMGDHPMFSGKLLTIRVAGEPQNPPASFPKTLPLRPSFEQDLRHIDETEIGARFAVEVTATDTMNREDFSKLSIRYKAEVGTVQEWHLTNTEYVTSHPIHMHVNAFQVISYNTYTGPYAIDDGEGKWKLYSQSGETCKWQHSKYDESVDIPAPSDVLKHLGHEVRQREVGGIGYADIGEWRDTILVPPLSNITIRFETDSHVGVVVLHCHLLSDADQGMSMLTEIVEPGSLLTANITSDGAYPWSCMDNSPIPQPNRGS